MTPAGPWSLRFVLAAALTLVMLPLGTRVGSSTAAPEVRALWVLRSSLVSPQSIGGMVQAARANGFNTLLVQVRGRGDAYFNGGLEPRAPQLEGQPSSFDPLQETLTAAHDAGLRVHAWVNVNLVSSAVELPAARDHVIYRHPDWLMVPRALAVEMARVDPGSPAYIGRLARWTRAQAQDFEGLYASPILPGVADHVAAIVGDLTTRYAVDGVHLDYVRFPSDEFDYSRFAMAEFRTERAAEISPPERARIDARQAIDLFAWPDAFPERWQAFRRARLTALVSRVRAVVKERRPEALLSAAVVADPDEARARRLQDWRGWTEAGLLDVVCPMAYTPDGAAFAAQIASVRQVAGDRPVWAGIGAYRLPLARTLEHIATARRLGARGIALFSYDSLTDRTSADYLEQLGRAAFATTANAAGLP